MNGRTAKLLRRAARAAQVNERALGRQWRSLDHRERGVERSSLERVLWWSRAKDADTLAAQMGGIVRKERRKRAESPIILPPRRLVLP